jgi:hypothetical protein
MNEIEEVIAFFIRERDRQPNRWQKTFVGIYLVLGIAAISGALYLELSQNIPILLFLLIGIPYLAIGFWVLWNLDNDRECARMMLDALEHGGRRLAWIYVEEVRGTYVAAKFHYLFTNKRHAEIVGPEPTITALYAFFLAHFPDVSCGYTLETQKLFKHDPQSLKTIPTRSGMKKETITEDNPSSFL